MAPTAAPPAAPIPTFLASLALLARGFMADRGRHDLDLPAVADRQAGELDGRGWPFPSPAHPCRPPRSGRRPCAPAGATTQSPLVIGSSRIAENASPVLIVLVDILTGGSNDERLACPQAGDPGLGWRRRGHRFGCGCRRRWRHRRGPGRFRGRRLRTLAVAPGAGALAKPPLRLKPPVAAARARSRRPSRWPSLRSPTGWRSCGRGLSLLSSHHLHDPSRDLSAAIVDDQGRAAIEGQSGRL